MQINKDPGGLLKDIECFALDMDGTVYLGERWIDGAPEFLRRIEQSGRRYCFLTNNSSKSANSYIEKLERMGLKIPPDRLITSAHATIDYLRREHPGERVYLMGNPVLREEFLAAGIPLSEEDAQVVVTAFDTSLTYQKLCRVCDYLRAGLPFVATHPDINCPTESGFIPDIGSFHALIEASTGRRPDLVVGKPGREMAEYMLRQLGCPRERCAMVGDRLYTDIAFGTGNGMKSILVLSGEASVSDLASSPAAPDLIFSSVKDILPLL